MVVEVKLYVIVNIVLETNESTVVDDYASVMKNAKSNTIGTSC